VYYAEAEYLDPAEAVDFAARFDQDHVLFVVDDCHKAPEDVDWFVHAATSLSSASFLFVSRPIQPAAIPRADSALRGLLESDAVLNISATAEVVRLLVSYDYHQKMGDIAPFTLATEDAAKLAKVTGNDLQILSLLLKSWNPHNETLASIIDERRLYQFVVSHRLHSDLAQQILLTVAALYQFEITVQSRFLPKGFETFMSDGQLLDSTYQGGRGHFVRLPHPSLATLYLHAAAWNDVLNPPGTDEFTFIHLRDYLMNAPLNYFGVLKGLSIAGQQGMLSRLCAESNVRNTFLTIARDSDTPITRFAGTAGFVAQASRSFARSLWGAFLETREPAPSLLLLSKRGDFAADLTLRNLMTIAPTQAGRWVASVQADAVRLTLLDATFEERCAYLHVLRVLGWGDENVYSVIDTLGPAFLTQLANGGAPHSRSLSELAKRQKALRNSRRQADAVRARGIPATVALLKRLSCLQASVEVHRIAMSARELADDLIRSIGCTWFLGDGKSKRASIITRLVKTIGDPTLRIEFFRSLTTPVFEELVDQSTPNAVFSVFLLLSQVDAGAGLRLARVLERPATLKLMTDALEPPAQRQLAAALHRLDMQVAVARGFLKAKPSKQ
jgi:hypothetical protein